MRIVNIKVVTPRNPRLQLALSHNPIILLHVHRHHLPLITSTDADADAEDPVLKHINMLSPPHRFIPHHRPNLSCQTVHPSLVIMMCASSSLFSASCFGAGVVFQCSHTISIISECNKK